MQGAQKHRSMEHVFSSKTVFSLLINTIYSIEINRRHYWLFIFGPVTNRRLTAGFSHIFLPRNLEKTLTMALAISFSVKMKEIHSSNVILVYVFVFHIVLYRRRFGVDVSSVEETTKKFLAGFKETWSRYMYDFINTKHKNTLTAKITQPPENDSRNRQKPRGTIIIWEFAHIKEKI